MTEESLLVGGVLCCLVVLVSFPVAWPSYPIILIIITSVEEGLKELKDLKPFAVKVCEQILA